MNKTAALSPERTGDETDAQRDVELRLNVAGSRAIILSSRLSVKIGLFKAS